MHDGNKNIQNGWVTKGWWDPYLSADILNTLPCGHPASQLEAGNKLLPNNGSVRLNLNYDVSVIGIW